MNIELPSSNIGELIIIYRGINYHWKFDVKILNFSTYSFNIDKREYVVSFKSDERSSSMNVTGTSNG